MTQTNLPAGRELDVLVAEKVLGVELKALSRADIGAAVMSGMVGNQPYGDYSVMAFKWNDKFVELQYQGSKWNYDGADSDDGYGRWFWDIREGKSWQPDIEAHVEQWQRQVPAYSTHITAAWQVVKHMRASGWEFELKDHNLGSPSRGPWFVMFSPVTDEVRGPAFGWADTAPLAIVRAALAAVG